MDLPKKEAGLWVIEVGQAVWATPLAEIQLRLLCGLLGLLVGLPKCWCWSLGEGEA